MLRAKLVERLRTIPNLVAAYLLGSQARGDMHEKSDIDIGVWLLDPPKKLAEYPFDLSGDLVLPSGPAIDLVVLNGASSDLVHRVLRDSILLIENDASARIRYEVRARNEYFDMLPIWNEYRRPRSATNRP